MKSLDQIQNNSVQGILDLRLFQLTIHGYDAHLGFLKKLFQFFDIEVCLYDFTTAVG